MTRHQSIAVLVELFSDRNTKLLRSQKKNNLYTFCELSFHDISHIFLNLFYLFKFILNFLNVVCKYIFKHFTMFFKIRFSVVMEFSYTVHFIGLPIAPHLSSPLLPHPMCPVRPAVFAVLSSPTSSKASCLF